MAFLSTEQLSESRLANLVINHLANHITNLRIVCKPCYKGLANQARGARQRSEKTSPIPSAHSGYYYASVYKIGWQPYKIVRRIIEIEKC